LCELGTHQFALRLNALLPLPQDVKVDVMVPHLKHVAECTRSELTVQDTQQAVAIQSEQVHTRTGVCKMMHDHAKCSKHVSSSSFEGKLYLVNLI